MNKTYILLVDDEIKILTSLAEILTDRGYDVITARSVSEALVIVAKHPIDAILLDLVLGQDDGIEVLKNIKQTKPEIPVIILTGHGTIAKAVEATKLGASDFLEKPLESERIAIAISNALVRSRLEKERCFFLKDAQKRFTLIGHSPSMEKIRRLIETVAITDAKVMITGDSGTGKELVAHSIHLHSSRAAAPFIAVNCAAIPEELIESELFGHEKGSFTGAHQKKEGKFELAGGGTLFLDEIGDMSLKLQAKILRAIEEGEITRVGGQAPFQIDVRIITASNKDLKAAVRGKTFREDLFFRLSVINIQMPTLRERPQDIPLLASHFLEIFSLEKKQPAPDITTEAMSVLVNYNWPGNVRELKNFIEKLFVFFPGRALSGEEVALLLSDSALDGLGCTLGPATLSDARHNAERETILKTLVANDWDYEKTIKDLGISRATFFNKLKDYQIKRPV